MTNAPYARGWPAARSVGSMAESIAGVPPALFVLLFVVLPAVGLFLGAGLGGNVVDALWGPGLGARVARQALTNSLVQGGLSAAIAVAWGYPCGVFVGRHRFRGREPLLGFLLVPFLLPPLVVVFGIDELFGGGGAGSGLGSLGHGLPAIVLANVFYNAPVVTLFTAASITNASPELEEAVGTLGGGGWLRYRDGWGRGSLLGAASGGLLTFLLSFVGFAAPLLLGGPSNFTIEVWIYSLTRTVFAAPQVAAGLALWTVAFLAVPTMAYLLIAQRAGLQGSRVLAEPRLARVHWRHPVTLGLGATLVALLAFVVAMLGSVLLLSFHLGAGDWGLTNWSELFAPRTTAAVGLGTSAAVANTLFFAGAESGLVIVLVVLVGFASDRFGRTRGLLEGFAFLPVLLSPVILAFALRSFWGATLGAPPFLWVLIVASQAALAFPFVLQGLRGSLRGVPPALPQAARSLGSTPWAAFWDVNLPLVRPALVAGATFAFALGLGEFAATNFLYIPTYTTLVVETYLLQTLRLTGAASAAAALLVVVSGIALALSVRWGSRVRF